MTTSAHVTELIAFTIDCSDAAQTTVLGVTLNFQGVKGYARPAWPGQEHPLQYHLDFRVPGLEKATAHAVELGAPRTGEQPREVLWRVMIDPDGHPFCLCPPQDPNS